MVVKCFFLYVLRHLALMSCGRSATTCAPILFALIEMSAMKYSHWVQSLAIKSRWFSDDGVCLFLSTINGYSDKSTCLNDLNDLNITICVLVKWPAEIESTSTQLQRHLGATEITYFSIEICRVFAIFCVAQDQYKSIPLFRFHAIKWN